MDAEAPRVEDTQAYVTLTRHAADPKRWVVQYMVWQEGGHGYVCQIAVRPLPNRQARAEAQKLADRMKVKVVES